MTPHFFKLSPGLLAAAALFNTVAFGQSPTVVTTDKVHGYPGIVRGPSQFLSGTGGHTGQAGDYGMDFGRSGGGATVAVTNASFMNFAATNDIITISLWLKRYDIANSSVFWGHATSVSRGIQAHAPWSDETIYFDAGNGGAGRISQNISSFPDYQTVGDDSWWTNWHHLVFVKNGSDAQIWIDSQEFHSVRCRFPWRRTFFDLYIGASGPAAGDNNMHGIMDDFAVFSTAVTPANITNLYTGALPTALSGETVLAYWDFNDPPVIMPPVGNFQGFSIRVNDLGGNVLNTNSIVLSLNGNNVVPTSVTKLASTATITYLLPNPPFASGSTQYTGISIRDQGGTLYTNYAFFVAPQLLLRPLRRWPYPR